MSDQTIRWLAIGAASELGIFGMATAIENAGFDSTRAFVAAIWGMHWMIGTAALIVLDHEARGRGK